MPNFIFRVPEDGFLDVKTFFNEIEASPISAAIHKVSVYEGTCTCAFGRRLNKADTKIMQDLVTGHQGFVETPKYPIDESKTKDLWEHLKNE